MSLLRAALLSQPVRAVSRVRHGRCYSDDHHNHDHHGEAEHAELAPEGIAFFEMVENGDGFSWTFWRNSILTALVAVGFWNYAPAPTEDVYLTRWIAMYHTSAEEWLRLNLKHLVQSQHESQGIQLITDARRPPMYRYRFPQRFENYSAHRVPVGSQVDTSDLRVKGYDEQI